MLEVAGTTLYSIDEISKMFKVHVQTVRAWIKSKKMNAKKIGKFYYVSEEDLKNFLKH